MTSWDNLFFDLQISYVKVCKLRWSIVTELSLSKNCWKEDFVVIINYA